MTNIQDAHFGLIEMFKEHKNYEVPLGEYEVSRKTIDLLIKAQEELDVWIEHDIEKMKAS